MLYLFSLVFLVFTTFVTWKTLPLAISLVNNWQFKTEQNPPTLSYCCHDRQTMPLSHYTPCPHAVKIHRRANRKLSKHRQRRQSRLLLIWNKVSGPSAFKLNNFKEIQTIHTVLWLFNVSWQITVSAFARWRHTHKNRSAFWVSPPFVSYQSRGVL